MRPVRAPTAIATCLAAVAAAAWIGFRLGTRAAPETETPGEPPAVAPEPISERVAAPSAEVSLASSEALIEVRRDSPASELNRDAIAALEGRDLARAVELFEQALALEPGETVLRHNLAEALVRRAVGERENRRPCGDCLEWLERAIDLAPERAPLASLLARWKSEAAAEAGFWRDSSLHFDLSYDGDRTELLHGAARWLEVLERDYVDLAERFGDRPAEGGRRRFAVVLYRREQFGDVTGLGDWAAGSFDGVIRVPIEDLERDQPALHGVLRHELVHAFVREVGGEDVPGWLNEGLAQVLEPDAARDVAAARRDLAGTKLYPLDRLAGSLAAWGDPKTIARAYAQSLGFCEYIARTFGDETLFRLVKGCAKGEAPAATFAAWTGIELDLALSDFAAELEAAR